MTHRIIAVALVVAFAVLAHLAGAPAADAGGLSWRVSEPVIVFGSQLGHFDGQPVDEIGVWVLDNDAWVRLASQVDQRDAADDFVPDEDDNVLDENDELVFMADLLGEQAPDDSWPPGVSQELTPAQLKITDPLRTDFVGYAYVFESPAAVAGPPLVSFDEPSGEIRSDSYVLGYASPEGDGFFGLKRLSLMGDSRNRIDRTKLRVTIPALGEFNEESVGQFGGMGQIQPVIEGPVRLVMDPGGSSTAYTARATLFGLNIDVEIPFIPGLEVRLSIDFSPDASGATYRAENMTDSVSIDGQPDTIRQFLFPMWREILFEEGRLIMLTEGVPTPLLVRPYYKDDATPDEADTGDKMSYGDNGVIGMSLDALANVGYLGQMVALSPGGDITAADLAEQLANPIVIEVMVEQADTTIYLPFAVRKTR